MHPLRKAFAIPHCPICGKRTSIVRPVSLDSAVVYVGIEILFWSAFVVFAALLAHWVGYFWIFAIALIGVYPLTMLIEGYLSGFHCDACQRLFSFREVTGACWRLYRVA